MSVRWLPILGLLALGALPLAGQPPPASEAPRNAVTLGLGMSYGGLGVSGEFDLGRRRISALAGVGLLPGFGPEGFTAGARYRLRGAWDPIYLQLCGTYFADGAIYGPALLVGRSNDGRRGTLHFAIGAGRATNGSITLAIDVGFGWFWGGPRRRPQPTAPEGDARQGPSPPGTPELS